MTTITLIGNIGSGKSTLMPLLAQKLSCQTIDADTLFQSSDPFAQEYLADMQRWAFANELWLTHRRAQMLKDSTAELTLVDSGLMMSWVYTYSHYAAGRLTQAEWDFYQELFDEWTESLVSKQAVVYLHNEVPVLLDRIKERGRDYELEWYTPEYLGDLQRGLQALVTRLQEGSTPVLILENLGDVRSDDGLGAYQPSARLRLWLRRCEGGSGGGSEGDGWLVF